jgi:hypothetical protein
LSKIQTLKLASRWVFVYFFERVGVQRPFLFLKKSDSGFVSNFFIRNLMISLPKI